MNRWLLVVSFALIALGARAQMSTDGGAFGSATGTDSARFGALVGANTGLRPSFAAPAAVSSSWGGAPTQSCAGVDFDTFVNTVKPAEILNQLQTTYRSGAQAAVTNYMLTLNTSNPTLAATLDMVDRMFTQRFNGFAQMCQAQESAKLSSDPHARRLSEATDQCFASRVGKGSSPSEAIRECKSAAVVAGESIPGRYDLKGFLENFTNVKVEGDVEYLVALLSDEQVTAQGVQARAPQRSLTEVKGFIEDYSRNALNKILDGTNPNDVETCRGEHFSRAPSSSADACIPVAAATLVRGQAFLAARALNATEQDMYASALSEQMSAVSVQSSVIALRQALMNMAPKSGVSLPAGEIIARRARILAEVNRIENDAAQLARVSDQRAQLARTQLLAMQRAADQIASRREAAEQALPVPKTNGLSGLRSFLGL